MHFRCLAKRQRYAEDVVENVHFEEKDKRKRVDSPMCKMQITGLVGAEAIFLTTCPPRAQASR